VKNSAVPLFFSRGAGFLGTGIEVEKEDGTQRADEQGAQKKFRERLDFHFLKMFTEKMGKKKRPKMEFFLLTCLCACPLGARVLAQEMAAFYYECQAKFCHGYIYRG